MSGGSWNYLHYQIEEAACMLAKSTAERRQALGNHLGLVATAMKAIEMVDSGDSTPESENDAIDAVFGVTAPSIYLHIVTEDAKKIHKRLGALLQKAEVES